MIIGIIWGCFLFYIGPNFYSILIHSSEEPHSVRATLQIVLLVVIWCEGVRGVVKSKFVRFGMLFTLYILVGITQFLLEQQRTAMRFLAPMAHCLGCLVGTVFGLYFNRLGINTVSGCLLGIISAALIMQSIGVMVTMCGRLVGVVLVRVLRQFFLVRVLLEVFELCCYSSSMLFVAHRHKLFCALYFMGNIISYLILKFTHCSIYGVLCGPPFGMFTGFTGMVIQAIANKKYKSAYSLSSMLVSSILFAAVGWYRFGVISIFICTCTGLYTGIFMIDLFVADKHVCGNVTGNLVLCFTCRLLGAGIGSLFVLPLFSCFGLLASSLAEKANRLFSLSFIQSVWQYTANLGGQYGIEYGEFMWMKQIYEGLLGSLGLSLAMLVGIGSGAFLGGLCGHAVLMLANRSNNARVARWSLMVSGSVVGALTTYSAFRLKVSVPVGALLGCGITAAILLWRGGFHFKSYFQRTFQLDSLWEIFNDMARMEH